MGRRGHVRLRRTFNFLLISLVIHLSLINFSVFLPKTGLWQIQPDAVNVEIITAIDESEIRKQQPRAPVPNRRLITQRRTVSETEFHPQTIRMESANNKTKTTVLTSTEVPVYDALRSPTNSNDKLVEMSTYRTLDQDKSSLSKPISKLTSSAKGEIQSFRQRVRSYNDRIIGSIKSDGTADIGMIGELPAKNGTGAEGEIESNNPFAKALQKIAQHIVETSEKGKVNVVFLIDTSASMRDNIQQVAAHLYAMTDTYDEHMLEYFLGMIEFSVLHGEKTINVEPLRADVGLLKNRMQKIGMSGDEYALDALLYSLDSVRFQIDADKYLILVTDEASGTAIPEMAKVLQDKINLGYDLSDISVNVLGFDEPFQKQLARRTNGLWQEIPGGTFTTGSLPAHRKSNESLVNVFRRISAEIRRSATRLLPIDFQISNSENLSNLEIDNQIFRSVRHAFDKRGITFADNAQFKRVGRNRWRIYNHLAPYYVSRQNLANSDMMSFITLDQTIDRTYTVEYKNSQLNIFNASPESTSNEGKVDIVLMFDYSRSMSGKSQALSHGIAEFYQEMDLLPIDYHIGLIRFAVATDVIRVIDGAEILTLDSGKHSPLSESDIEVALTDPFGGDEQLLNAVVDGLPRFKFRPGSTRYVVVMTDELATGTYSPDKALQVCKDLAIRVFVFGVSTQNNNFQTLLASETGGLFFQMPNAFRRIYKDK